MSATFNNPKFCKTYSYPNKPFLEIRPNNDKSVISLQKWVKENYDILRKEMSIIGGLLFKGFDIKTPEDFDLIARTIEPKLCTAHDFDDGTRLWYTDHIYEASLGSIAKEQIPLSFHNEDAFVPYVPSTIMLCSLQASKYGGETIMADCRKVFASFPQELQQKFLDKDIKNSFTMHDSTFLVNTRLPKNEKAIIKLATKYGATKTYRIGDFSTRFTFEIPTVIKHESSDKPIWFSRAHQTTSLSRIIDIWHSYKYKKNIFSTFEGFYVMIKTILSHYWFQIRMAKIPDEQKNIYTLKNGEPISVGDQFKICSAYWKNAVIEPLNAGDFIILDNRLVTHGRLPYKGHRRLLSCIGDQIMVKKYKKTR